MSRSRWRAGIVVLRWLVIGVFLAAGCWLGIYADTPGVAQPELLHAVAVGLLGWAAATGLLRYFPLHVVAIVIAVLLAIIVTLPPGSKHLGYELCTIIVVLALTVVQLVLPH